MNENFCNCGHHYYSHAMRDDTTHCLIPNCDCMEYQAQPVVSDIVLMASTITSQRSEIDTLRAELEYCKGQYERGFADAKRKMAAGLKRVENALRTASDDEAKAIPPEARERYAFSCKLMAEQVELLEP